MSYSFIQLSLLLLEAAVMNSATLAASNSAAAALDNHIPFELYFAGAYSAGYYGYN